MKFSFSSSCCYKLHQSDQIFFLLHYLNTSGMKCSFRCSNGSCCALQRSHAFSFTIYQNLVMIWRCWKSFNRSRVVICSSLHVGKLCQLATSLSAFLNIYNIYCSILHFHLNSPAHLLLTFWPVRLWTTSSSLEAAGLDPCRLWGTSRGNLWFSLWKGVFSVTSQWHHSF